MEVCDPWVDSEEARHEYGVVITEQLNPRSYDAIILAVAHDQFKAMTEQEIRAYGKDNHVLYDLKYVLPTAQSDLRL